MLCERCENHNICSGVPITGDAIIQIEALDRNVRIFIETGSAENQEEDKR